MTEISSAVLYGYFRSSASYRVRIALALKGLSVRHKTVYLPGGEQNTPAYLRVNPAGLVPAWIDGDVRLTQSIAIIEYLEEIHRGTGDRARDCHDSRERRPPHRQSTSSQSSDRNGRRRARSRGLVKALDCTWLRDH